MAQELADWSELQYDLLVLIARRLNLIEDYLNFGTVCKSWHSVPTKNNFNNYLYRAPWLMLAEEDENSIRKFFSLYNGMILNKRIPKASRKRCMESMGWLIMVGVEGEISTLHPFSGVQIELPHQNTTVDYDNHRTGWKMGFIFKAVLSANPSHTSDYLLMVIEGNARFLGFWRPGDIRWTRVTLLPKDDCDRIPLTFIPIADEREVQDDEYTYGTRNFRVFQVDLAAGKMAETRELGDTAFFLGANTSLSVQASQFPGIKPNHIYFSDYYFVTYLAYEEGGGLDMGVFNLADGSIQPHYNGVSLSHFCPPTWVTPTLY
ncbi:hypothetical protein KY290_018621 [Solanum tuberosum]|uniref:Ubiquitin-protein ligase n=1 Tax=Solanum tuberosum TaxID=4113 RepID=A0ABQ7VGV4_SOLTU|nr:hypothetical protein KY289_017744 [Solanum tuberosum]KAH0762548.1 hypothetical protein KY290_018621 [Solanum tuberosum]